MQSVNYVLLGGNGYFGYNFIKYLIQTAAARLKEPPQSNTQVNIVVVDKNTTNTEVLNQYPYIHFIHCDLAFKDYPTGDVVKQINKYLVNGQIYLINFAADSFVDTSIKKPFLTMQNNIYEAIAFCKIAIACKKRKGSKIIHISTDEVFNRFEKVISARSSYSVSKDVIEDIILNLVPETIILRPSNLFGCFDYTDKNCIQRHPTVIKNLVNRIYEIHNKQVSRRFIHINEACQTLQALCLGQRCPNLNNVNIDMDYFNEINVYVFNDDTEINISELIKYVAKQDNAEVIELEEDPRDEKQDYDYNTYYEIQSLEIRECKKTDVKKISLEDIYEEIKRMRTQS